MTESGSAFQQSNFLGGEWSSFAQGRIDDPRYKTALNTSENGIPLEEGAWTRRSGRRRLGDTNLGDLGVVRTFWLPNHKPCVLEMTYSTHYEQAFLRFWVQQFGKVYSDDLTLLCDSYVKIVNLSNTTPAVLTINSAPGTQMNGTVGWFDSDIVQIFIDPSLALANGPGWSNRQFLIHKLTDVTFELYDAATGVAINGSTTGFYVAEYGNSFAAHAARFELPYTSLDELRRVRVIQTGDSAYFLNKNHFPQRLTQVIPAPPGAVSTDAPWFTLGTAEFFDGPYLDPLPGSSQTGNSHGTVFQEDQDTGLSLFDVADGAYNFQASDIGRMIRIWCQPQPYQKDSDYTNAGNGPPRATWQGNFWALNIDKVSHSTSVPGVNSDWYIDSSFGRWGYGIIKYTKDNDVSLAFQSQCLIEWHNPIGLTGGLDGDTIVGNSLLATGLAAPDGAQVDTWQLGVYTTGQYPSCGAFYQGRLWLAGALPNRIDACMSDGGSTGGFMTLPNLQDPAFYPTSTVTSSTSNVVVQATSSQATWGTSQGLSGTLGSQPLTGATVSTHQVYWCPTNAQGQVYDNHGISLVLNASEQELVNYLHSHHEGLVAGSISGEYVIQSNENGGSLTPTDALVKKVTRFGSASIEAIRVGGALLFVQAFGRRVIEFIVDIWARRFIGRHLNEYSKHLTSDGIIEVAYQEESAPIVWCCTSTGKLISCSYRRFNNFQPEPVFAGWSKHPLPDNRNVMSVTMAANQDGSLDQLVMLTSDAPLPAFDPNQPAT
jgi:hypothetical protein